MFPEIREINDEKDLKKFLPVILKSFATVSDEFNLTKENAPTNPSFLTIERLNEIYKKIRCFGLYYNGTPIGFFGLEESNDSLIILEKLSVLPSFRHNGYGKMILDYSVSFAYNNNFTCISAAIINMNKRLKDWYLNYGFKETNITNFAHLPFEVCFMEFTVK